MAEAKLNFESLKNDVGAIQFCISEIIPTLGEIHASSWRFPEISSSEVNTKKLLDKIAFTENEAKFATARTLLLELAIDRLVFLLQCAFKLLESCTDEGNSAVIPLTLGSAVRKFTKKALRVNHTITAHRQQLNKKSELIVKLQNNVRVLEKDNTSLRETLAIAASKPEAEEVKEIKEVFVEKPQLEYIPVIDCKPDVESVAVQTTETAFALCASCINMQKCLLSCSTLTSQLCTSLSITSIVAEKDFQSHLNETGRIDQNLWLTLSQQDVKSVLKGISKLQEQCTKLKSELSSKDRNVKSLDFKLNEVKQEFNQCKRNSEAAQIQYKDDMANLSTEYETKFDHLREQNTKLLQDIDSIEALANEYRIRETHFKKEIDNARKCQKEFEEKLSAATSEISDQKKRCQGLQEGIRALTDELQLMKSEIEEKVVTLKKAETQNKTLSKRDKAMQGKHLTLLSKLEQLGQECNTLRTDLGGTLHDREAMAHVLSELELKCGQLQQQLIMEEQRASESFMTQKSLQLTVEALGNQLEDVKVELEQEKEKCLLLMDYPSLNGADPNYLEYIASLDYFQSQNHLSANMIRIMLLEDQNKDLRKIAEEDATKGQGNFKLQGPVPLWKDDLLRKMKQEYKSVKKNKLNRAQRSRSSDYDDVIVMDMEKTSSSIQAETPATAKQNSNPHSRSSSGRTRGSIGRLMTALNESKLVAPPNSFVTLHGHD